jgi:hypothetical protein
MYAMSDERGWGVKVVMSGNTGPHSFWDTQIFSHTLTFINLSIPDVDKGSIAIEHSDTSYLGR